MEAYFITKEIMISLIRGVIETMMKTCARGVIVGNGHGDTSSKSWTRLIVFHIALIPLGKVWIQLFSLQL